MLCRNTEQEQEQEKEQELELLEMVILRTVLVIPKFERGTKFRESWESVWSCDCSASRADES